jgi:hypothetical protein
MLDIPSHQPEDKEFLGPIVRTRAAYAEPIGPLFPQWGHQVIRSGKQFLRHAGYRLRSWRNHNAPLEHLEDMYDLFVADHPDLESLELFLEQQGPLNTLSPASTLPRRPWQNPGIRVVDGNEAYFSHLRAYVEREGIVDSLLRTRRLSRELLNAPALKAFVLSHELGHVHFDRTQPKERIHCAAEALRTHERKFAFLDQDPVEDTLHRLELQTRDEARRLMHDEYRRLDAEAYADDFALAFLDRHDVVRRLNDASFCPSA